MYRKKSTAAGAHSRHLSERWRSLFLILAVNETANYKEELLITAGRSPPYQAWGMRRTHWVPDARIMQAPYPALRKSGRTIGAESWAPAPRTDGPRFESVARRIRSKSTLRYGWQRKSKTRNFNAARYSRYSSGQDGEHTTIAGISAGGRLRCLTTSR